MSIVSSGSTNDPVVYTKTKNNQPNSLRIGFWGTRTLFSTQVLMALLRSYPLTHVALPVSEPDTAAVTLWPPPSLPSAADDLLIINHYVAPDTVQIAWQHSIPTNQISQLRSPIVQTWLADLALDVVCVACFPWRLPLSLLCLPTYGFLNIHPSFLPAYRGPAPLFWQLRAGLRDVGVTVHWMDANFDTGNIAAQATLTLPDGATSSEADRRCAGVGAELLDQVLQQLTQVSSAPFPRGLRQPPGGSCQSWPTAADFRLCLDWSARHAYNFMRGTAEWRQPYPVMVVGEELVLRTALAYDATASLAAPYVRNGDVVLIDFHPGVLQAVVW